MKKTKTKNIKKIVVTLIIIIVFTFSILSLNTSRNLTSIEQLIKDISININRKIVNTVNALVNDNQLLQDQNNLIEKNRNIDLEQEIKDLKKTLELNKTLTEYNPINATIISRNTKYWFSIITIDKGENHNIKKGMAVSTNAGLIGKISKTTKTTSEVKLLTTDDITFKVSVVIRSNDKEHYAILNGYDENNNLLKVSAIDKNTELNKGDVVLTSGLGQIPKGIYIGEVEKTEIDKYNIGKTIYIKPHQDFNNIKYVTILKGTN